MTRHALVVERALDEVRLHVERVLARLAAVAGQRVDGPAPHVALRVVEQRDDELERLQAGDVVEVDHAPATDAPVSVQETRLHRRQGIGSELLEFLERLPPARSRESVDQLDRARLHSRPLRPLRFLRHGFPEREDRIRKALALTPASRDTEGCRSRKHECGTGAFPATHDFGSR
jgi:GNAT superfamily N-acetyltransferase